jgi:D-alanine-D-alanine ligase
VEHEVSLASAASILRALDPHSYETRLLAIDPEGRWHLAGPALPPEASLDAEEVTLPAVPAGGALVSRARGDRGAAGRLDCIFPIVHGRGGEDGALQGLLELADVPYVGSGVLGSALQMDKEVAKRLLRAAGLPVVPWVLIQARELVRDAEASADRAVAELGLPLFVKPANLGSSVGITKVRRPADLAAAVGEAAAFDPKLVIEESIDCREFECAVLGNDLPEASVIGELVPSHEFYDYADKYVDQGAQVIIPAQLDAATSDAMRALAVRAHCAVEAAGLSRVDFFRDQAGRILVNEINTMPGFTEISMYPKLWAASGLAYPALLDRLIDLALERHTARSKRRLSFTPPAPAATTPTKRRAGR